jgi:hypothetical protein
MPTPREWRVIWVERGEDGRRKKQKRIVPHVNVDAVVHELMGKGHRVKAIPVRSRRQQFHNRPSSFARRACCST